MRIGDTMFLRDFKTYFSTDGKSWVQYKAEKGKVFLAMLLGQVSAKAEPGEIEKAANEAFVSLGRDPSKLIETLVWIRNNGPATQEVSLASSMADAAQQALDEYGWVEKSDG